MADGEPRENIRVVCRFRPLNKTELQKAGGDGKCIISSMTDDTVVCTTSDGNNYNFSFDRVFGTNAQQVDVYKYIALPVVDSLFQGFNGCLLAYGQTGSGKTHTMMGSNPTSIDSGDEDPSGKGIIPRVVDEIFARALLAGSEMEFSISVSFVEIYCERIRDLFDVKKDNLAVGEDSTGGVYIKGVTEFYVTSREEVLSLMAQGNENRAVSATGMNAGSSRSHSLFLLAFTQRNTATGETTSGKLFLVDLAGSETVSKTGVSGQQLEELKKINKSLSSLGNVINSLTDGKSSHIPYRDSKLTRVLQECIGGNAKTTLIIACSPSTWNEMETLSTLRFGKRAKRIVNRATVNKERSPEEMKKMLGIFENAINSLLKITKLWVHGAESGHVISKPGSLGGSAFDLPAAIRSSLACIAAGSAALEGKDVEVVEMPGLESRTTTDSSIHDKPAIGGAGATDDDDGMGPLGATAAAADTGTATTSAAASVDGDQLQRSEVVADVDELQRTNDSLIELLREAGEELRKMKVHETQMREQYEETVRKYEALQETLTERDERIQRLVASSTAAASASASEETPRSGYVAHPESKSTESAPAASPAGKVDLELLRSNYHRALNENEELRTEIADLQARISHLESKQHDKDGNSGGERDSASPDALDAAGNTITATASNNNNSNSSKDSHESVRKQMRFDGLFVPCAVYEVIWEHQRFFPISGWSTDTHISPDDPPHTSAAACLPGNTNAESLAATRAAYASAAPELLPSPLLSAPVSKVARSREEVSLPDKGGWYWSKDWFVDSGHVDDDELLQAGWAYSFDGPVPVGRSASSHHRDGEGWQYATDWSAFGVASTTTEGAHNSQREGDRVRRRRWLRPRYFLDISNPESAQKHLTGLVTQMEVKEQMMMRMADELAARTATMRDLENKYNSVMMRMSEAAQTGDLTLIGHGAVGMLVGSSGMQVGVNGARIRAAPPAARSLKGGGGGGDGSNRKSTDAMGRFSTSSASAGGADSGIVGAFSSFWKRLSSSSPLRPEQMPASKATAGSGDGTAPLVGSALADKVAQVQAVTQALFDACEQGQLATVQATLRSNSLSVNCEDKVGRTPLLYAARGGQLAVVQYLVSIGADLHACDKDGRNALHYAARRGHVDTARWLLKMKLPVQQTDVHALTPLHQATLGKSLPMLEVLLDYGADVHARDANGCTALTLAQRFDDKKTPEAADSPIVQLLLRYGSVA